MSHSATLALVAGGGALLGMGVSYLLWGRRKESRSFPATSWPAGKPVLADPADYPEYDLERPPKESFEEICDMLIEEVLSELPGHYEMPAAEVDWVRKMLAYNVKGGKMNRGTMVVEVGKVLAKSQGRTLSNEDLVKLAVLGWCVEWLQAWLLMLDDVMDDSTTRRGQPCWYLNEHVKKIAINDGVMVEMCMFKVLKRHFADSPVYVQLLDLFIETTFQTECGQLLDTLCMNLTIEDFTVDRWTLIVKYKTAFYSFYLPVALGLTYMGETRQSAFDSAREILITMGIYFQAQDDYLDCFQPEELLGKRGTDIWDKKCSWLFANAYHHMTTPDQHRMLAENYGAGPDLDKEEIVKGIYRDVKLQEFYAKYESDVEVQLTSDIQAVTELPQEIFTIFLKKIFKRSK